MKNRTFMLSVVFASVTMLSAVGLVSTGGWLISSAALMPPMLTLQVATVSVRFFGIARGFFRWSERVVSHDAALAGTVENRVNLWRAASILGPRGIWRLRESDALDRLTADTDALQDDVVRVKTPFLAASLSAVILVALQTSILPLAGLVLAISLLFSGVAIPLMTQRIDRAVANAAIAHRNELSFWINVSLGHSDELLIAGQSSEVLAKIRHAEDQRIKTESRASAWSAISATLNGLSAGVSVFVALTLAATAYQAERLDGPMIAVLALLPWSSAEIIATFSQAATAKTRVEVAQTRIDHLLQLAEHRVSTSKPPRENFMASPSELQVHNLQVAWDDRVVVNDVSFALRRGQKIALTGASGSGKSSIAAAVLRLIEHEGTVSLDEVPVERLTDFRQHVVALMQATHVFSSTLRENLLIANGYASDEEISAAIRKAGLTRWFDSLPRGLDTLLGAAGQPMSGGEVQRLGIARLLVSSAAFIVLDEPTEHLDDITARQVWQTILDSFADRGLLIITHDSEVMETCDYVLALQNGQLRNTLTQ